MARENMTSSAKPELGLQYHNYRNTIGSMNKNLVQFGRVVSELCDWRDKQTYSSQYFAPLRGVSK